MKPKYSLPLFSLVVLLFSLIGNVQPALASANLLTATPPSVLIVTHDLSFWNATYVGTVTANSYDKWQFAFGETHSFVVTATPIGGDLIPLLRLLDATGNELARGIGSLTSTQPAGNYSVQVQPQSGSGLYALTLRDMSQSLPSVSTVVNPASINAGQTATISVNLNNVPATGYTSAEFTCTYNASLGAAGTIAATGLFGADPVVAISGPQNGSFIVAIAGSNGHMATIGGAAFTFLINGLQAGQTPIGCTARVSTGNNALTTILSTPASLTILGAIPTPTFTPAPSSTNTASPTLTALVTSTSTPTPTRTITSTSISATTSTSTSTSTFTSTPLPSFTPLPTFTPTSTVTRTPTSLPSFTPLPTSTPTATPVFSPSPTRTSTPLPAGTVSGQVLAGKPVNVVLSVGKTVITSVAAQTDGTFSLTAPAGAYTLAASASGFLGAEGPVTITAAGTTNMPKITLLAGDIDGSNVIDQFDALTIGMNYNLAVPAAADLNRDGIINVLDLELLAHNYRKTGPLAWQ